MVRRVFLWTAITLAACLLLRQPMYAALASLGLPTVGNMSLASVALILFYAAVGLIVGLIVGRLVGVK